ncbi:MAG: DUF1320 family protein [Phycisphaerae bacterium]|nr:DUF1320 family protein [Phycisphaerae bacterium]
MPTYATQADLEQFFSAANVADWADKDRDGALGPAEQAGIETALVAAEGIVDGYLARAGYAAPFAADAFAELPARVQSQLRQWTVTVAGFHIYAWRGLRDRANAMEALYARTLAQLQDLGRGTLLAGVARAGRVSAGTGRTVGQATDDLSHLRGDGWDW